MRCQRGRRPRELQTRTFANETRLGADRCPAFLRGSRRGSGRIRASRGFSGRTAQERRKHCGRLPLTATVPIMGARSSLGHAARDGPAPRAPKRPGSWRWGLAPFFRSSCALLEAKPARSRRGDRPPSDQRKQVRREFSSIPARLGMTGSRGATGAPLVVSEGSCELLPRPPWLPVISAEASRDLVARQARESHPARRRTITSNSSLRVDPRE